MRVDDVKVGMEVRYHKDGNLYKVTKIYEDEVYGGTHSFEFPSLDLENEISKETQVHPSEVSPAVIPQDELYKYVPLYMLQVKIGEFRYKYKQMTGDEITKIEVSNSKIIITGEKLGVHEFNL